ncbi:MAG: SpoIIE family protein phosphatase [Tenuifilaceae bacterium]
MKRLFKRASLFLFLSILSYIQVFAQKGIPYLSNYELPSTMSYQNWSMIQGDNNLMYILNRKGLYQFDGYEWNKLNVNGKPIAIFFSNNLFVSTSDDLGYLKKDEKGQYIYNSIENQTEDIYFKFVKLNNQVYASGTQNISRIITGESYKSEQVYSEDDSTQVITDFFELNGSLYIIKNNKTVYRLKDNKAELLRLGIPDRENILFAFNHDKNTYFGTSGNVLLRFDGFDTRTVFMKDQKYFDASIINSGISIDSSKFALGTLIGGCVVINSKTLESETILNYSNGLPDDEIVSLGADIFGGLWIASGMGISRADLNIPIKSFENYDGISGNILSIAEYNKMIYVGSSDGLYYLSEKKDFREIEVPVTTVKTIEKPIEVKKEPEQVVSEQQITQAAEEDSKKKKKGFFSKLFSKSVREEVRAEKEALSVAEIKTEDKKEISAAKKKIYSLQSVSHVYQKVPNIDGKCKQLFVYDNKLIAATSTGVYEVENNRAKSLVKGLYILYAKPSDFYNKTFYLCTTDGVLRLNYINNNWQTVNLFTIENEYPVSLVESSEDTLIISTEFNVYKLAIVQGGQAQSELLTLGGKSIDSPIVRKIAGVIKVFTTNQVFIYNKENDTLIEDESNYITNVNLIYSQDNYSWIKTDLIWKLYSKDKEVNISAAKFLGLFDKINDIYVSDKKEILLVNDLENIVRIKVNPKDTVKSEFSLFLKNVLDNEGNKIVLDEIKVSYSNNSLKVIVGAPFYVKEKSMEYQYLIVGKMNKWSEWTKTNPLDFLYLPSGKYTIQLRARDIFGNESKIYSLAFTIKPPFWKTPWFIGICLLFAMVSLVMLVKYRERQLQRDKQILEEKVVERTKTIEEQKKVLEVQRDTLAKTNAEIMQQKEEIEAQRDEIETQRDYIYKQNEEITQSIEYAKRIQTAVMPKKEEVSAILPEHFILFKPRDIVSGDFYWMAKKNNRIVIAAADCTGHGVPGAFMSMLGISFLNEIVIGGNETKPSIILNQLRDLIKSTLSQKGEIGESRDGMDIALCVIDLESKTLQFAGAYNPLYLIRNSELIEIKADKMPVGIHLQEKESFTNNEMSFVSGDVIYIFSDGYVSQFGGEFGRKYMAKPFKKMLAIIAEKPMDKQCEMLEQEFEEWRGFNHQVDDILIIGVKF